MKIKLKRVCLILIINFIFMFLIMILNQLIYEQNNAYSYLKSFNNSNTYLINNNTSVLLDLIQCENNNNNNSNIKQIKYHKNFVIIYNFIKAKKDFLCHESITFTTIANFNYLDNLIILVKRWQGPISVAVYTPGDDYHMTKKTIAYLRNCQTKLIKELVTFHIYFEYEHLPQMNLPYEDSYNCENGPPYENISEDETYKARNNLTFPINVGRNIARQSAQTHFVLALDIELYPTPNLIETFLGFVANNPKLFENAIEKNIYVLPIFEIVENIQIPNTKQELQEMFVNREAIWFHENICLQCHQIPRYYEWMKNQEIDGLNVFAIAKRQGRFIRWEPCYIGTRNEPLFNEDFTWEGESDKMSQVLSLCLLDYNFMILNNAFIIHKPGIKQSNKEKTGKYKLLIRESKSLLKNVANKLIEEYGKTDECISNDLRQ